MGSRDTDKVIAAKGGDLDAFGDLVRSHQALVFATVIANLRDTHRAEDIVQDAFVAAWKSLAELREPDKFRPWVCSIARNLAAKSRRKHAREILTDEPPEPSHASSGQELLLERERHAALTTALEAIPDDYREVLVLFYREGQSIREVARALALTESAAQKRISRGREALRGEVTSLLADRLPAPAAASVIAAVIASIKSLEPVAAAQASSTTLTKGLMMKLAVVTSIAAVAGTAIYIGTASGTPDDDKRAEAPAKAKTKAAPASKKKRQRAPTKAAAKPTLAEGKKAPAVAVPASYTRRMERQKKRNALMAEIMVLGFDELDWALKKTLGDPEFVAMTEQCFELAQRKQPDLYGDVTFRATISGAPETRGLVTGVTVTQRTRGFRTPNRNYEECVRQIILSVRFTGADRNRTIDVPFMHGRPYHAIPGKTTERALLDIIAKSTDPEELYEISVDRNRSHPRAANKACDRIAALGHGERAHNCLTRACYAGDSGAAERYLPVARKLPPRPLGLSDSGYRSMVRAAKGAVEQTVKLCKLKGVTLP